MKRLILGIILVATLFVQGTLNAQSFAFKQNQKLGRGVNFGNALEAPTEGEWGVTLQASYFQLAASKGFHSVRVPIRWSSHALTSAPYTIDAAFFARIDWVIENALRNKLMVIINCHHYNEIFENPAAHKERFLNLWSQIARRYANYSDSLIFEPLNEPNTNLTAELWNQYFAVAMDTIRHPNPKRTALVGIAEWGGIGALNKLVLPNDTNLILTVHYYNPYQFTHQGADWVSGSDAWLGTGWYNTEAERNTVKSEFEAIKAFSTAHNIPVHVGEFGAFNKADMESRIRWTNYCSRYFEEQGFSWNYWEFCDRFGIYDRVNLTWNQGLLDALVTMPMPAPYIDSSGNLVFNGDFSYGITRWTKYTDASASATFAVTGGKGMVTITNGGTQDWYVQLFNEGFAVENGKKYRLDFEAYASAGRSINFSVGKASSPYTNYFSNSTAITTSGKKYSYDFTMNLPTDNTARVVFNIGKTTGILYIDNVVLHEITTTGVEEAKGSGPRLYPVPVTNALTIDYPDMRHVLLFNSKGQKVLSHLAAGKSSINLDCSMLSNGVYIVQVVNKAGEIYNSTIQISHH